MSIRARLTLLPALGLALLALAALPGTSEAQFGKRLKDAVKRTAEDKAIQKTTEKENKAIDDALAGGGGGPTRQRCGDRCRRPAAPLERLRRLARPARQDRRPAAPAPPRLPPHRRRRPAKAPS